MRWWINQVTRTSGRWLGAELTAPTITSIPYQNVMNHIDRHTTGRVTEVLSPTADKLMGNLCGLEKNGGNEHKAMSSWRCTFPADQARVAPMVHRGGRCAILAGVWWSRTHGHIWQEEGALIRTGACQREDGDLVWCSCMIFTQEEEYIGAIGRMLSGNNCIDS